MSSEMTLILGNPKRHCAPLVRVGAHACQVINGVLANVHLTVVDPVGPEIYLWLFLQSGVHSWNR